jgi:hypothetical protein
MTVMAGNGMHMNIVLALLAFSLATCRHKPGMPLIIGLQSDLLCDSNSEEEHEK